MDIDKVLQAAERVKQLRSELAAAEEDLSSILGARSAKPAGKVNSSSASSTIRRSQASDLPPVTQRVAKFLAQHPDGSEFGVVVEGVQPATSAAVKSALNGMRAKGTATFRNGLYGPKENGARGLPRRRQLAVELPTT
jgi:hypothetical protein